MKNIPINPPLSAFASALFTHDDGILISNAPKNEKANRMKMAKKIKFKVALVEISYTVAALPVNKLTSTPTAT